MSKQVETRLKSVIKENYGEADFIDKVALDDSLVALGINSVEYIKLIVLIENEFGIVFDDANLDFNQFTKFEDLVKVIKSKIQ